MRTERMFGSIMLGLGLGLGGVWAFADTPGWSVDPGLYDFDGTITAAVYRGATQVALEGDTLGAFVGDECRGVTGVWRPEDFRLFLINIYSNTASGESLSFRYYDSSADAVCDIGERVEFVPDMIVGQILDPFQMHITNCQPSQPSNPLPTDGAADVVIDTALYWDGGDPDPVDEVTYNIYFGTDSDPPLYDNTGPHPATTTNIRFDLPPLILNETYFWKIVATDNHAKSNTGHIWSFTVTSEALDATTWSRVKALYR